MNFPFRTASAVSHRFCKCLFIIIWLQIFSESLFEGSSWETELRIYPWLKTSPPLSDMVVLFDRGCSFRKDAHGMLRGEKDTCLASQISLINPGDQWGDRCHNQIALTSLQDTWKEVSRGWSLPLCKVFLRIHASNHSLIHLTNICWASSMRQALC